MQTLCNKYVLRDGGCVFTNFNYTHKLRDVEGDIVVYTATLNYKGTRQQCTVSVQNSAVVAWQT